MMLRYCGTKLKYNQTVSGLLMRNFSHRQLKPEELLMLV